jgi:hypothetical protein
MRHTSRRYSKRSHNLFKNVTSIGAIALKSYHKALEGPLAWVVCTHYLPRILIVQNQIVLYHAVQHIGPSDLVGHCFLAPAAVEICMSRRTSSYVASSALSCERPYKSLLARLVDFCALYRNDARIRSTVWAHGNLTELLFLGTNSTIFNK